MRIIKGKSSAKGKRSPASGKKSKSRADVGDLFYTAEEFIAEISQSGSYQANGVAGTEDTSVSNTRTGGKLESGNNASQKPPRYSVDELSNEEAESLLLPKVSDNDKKSKRGRGHRKRAASIEELGKQNPRRAGNSASNADLAKKEYKQLIAKGIRLLAMREHSVKEVIKKLSQKCESLDLVYAAVDELRNNNYLSDQRFAESFVRSRQNRGFGPNKIRMELNEKGIENNLIDDYLNVNSSVWYESAAQQYSKKYGDGPVDDYKTWAKRARFMQSRGFSMEHIQVVVPAPSYS